MKSLIGTCLAYVIACSLLLCCSATAWAQVASSTIAGAVTDSSGAVLPGVTVEAASPALIEKTRIAVTDGQGLYRMVDLRPGIYAVTFTLPGFSTFRREGLELTAGVGVDISMECAGSQGALDATQPIFLAAVAFGLATDYGVFLLSRIKEARDSGVSDSEAIPGPASTFQRLGVVALAMVHIGFATPAWPSFSTSARRASSRPASRSSAIRCSHAWW